LTIVHRTRIQQFNGTFEDVSELEVCSEIDLVSEDALANIELRYYADDFVSELYHIQRAEIDGSEEVNLYDLDTNSSTEFTVYYENQNYVAVEDAIVQLQRKYISEGVYRTVEAPLTSSEGKAIVHVNLDANKYKATIVKNGVVLDVIENIVFNCQNELSGECIENLRGAIDPQNDVPVTQLEDFAYTITEGDSQITVTFSIPSTSSSYVNMQVEQLDQFGNSTVCNKTVFSSSGAIVCEYNNNTITDSYLTLKVFKDDNLKIQKQYYIAQSGGLDFGGNNFVIMIIFILSLVGMSISSPEWIVVNGVVTLLFGGMIWLVSGIGFVEGLGMMMYLVVAAVILISKMAKQEDR
jgi:hypothetical protein